MSSTRGSSSNPWSTRPIHRIFVYTEHGMSQSLVGRFLEETPCEVVVDPFMGSATVGVEAAVRGLGFIGIDSNPAAVVVALGKLKPNTPLRLKPLPRVKRYYQPAVYRRLRALAARVSTALEAAVFFKVARAVSNLEFSPAPKFKRVASEVDPRPLYRRWLREARRDVALLRSEGDVVWGDSTAWLPRRVCGVLTSPPFANNVDYARHTMLELLWLGYGIPYVRSLQLPACESAARAWKKALDIGIEFGGKRARGYRRFYSQYLYYMGRHFQLLADALEWEAWYTIGDSYLGGVYLPVHQHLKKLAEEAGLKADVVKLGERPMKRGRTLYLLRVKQKF